MQGVSVNGTVICYNLDNTPQNAAQLDLAGKAATELAPTIASHLACEAADGESCDFWTAASEGGLLLVRERHGDQRGAFGQGLYMFMGSAGARGLVTPIGWQGSRTCSVRWVGAQESDGPQGPWSNQWRIVNRRRGEGSCSAYIIRVP